ncbi:MAG: SMC-Scp complex subunit ScpB, partial [bacterium]|nr:SMC-Scp complex subunit ScpB [bacterium]
QLAKILNKDESEIINAIDELEKDLENRGIKLIKNNGEVMLGSAPETSQYCEIMLKEELDKTLGRAALETLAIVLYKGAFLEDGVNRAEIDLIRGVNSTFTLRNLSIRGLVTKKINNKDKRSVFYAPSTQLLQYLGITKKENLPQFEEFIKQMEENADTNY